MSRTGLSRSTSTFVLFCCDFLGMLRVGTSAGQALEEIGDPVVLRRHRLIMEALKMAARATSGPALMIAALFEGLNPEDILATAVERF